MNIKPNIGRILIKKIKPEEKTGGILLPESAQEKSIKGQVISVGEFEKDKEYDFKKDQIVIFAKWGGTEVGKDSDDNEYVIMKCEEILGTEVK